MKSMKKRLQIRFVLISVTALLVLQSLIVAFSIAENYRHITVQSDRLIMLTATSPESSETADARYFSVTYNFQNKTFEADLSHIALVTRAQAADYAKKVIDSKSDKGYIDDFRYLVRRDKDSIQVTFLSRAVALDYFRSNSTSLIVISLIGIAAMTAILIAVSGKIVEPIVKNRQKQKEFITSASHELKTPLTVIHADAQLLETDIGENEWLTDIIKQTNYDRNDEQAGLSRASRGAGTEFRENRFPDIRFGGGHRGDLFCCCTKQREKVQAGYREKYHLLRR